MTSIRYVMNSVYILHAIIIEIGIRTAIVMLPTLGYLQLSYMPNTSGIVLPNQPPLLRWLLCLSTLYTMFQFGKLRMHVITAKTNDNPRRTLLHYLGWPTVCSALVFAYVWKLSAWSHLMMVFYLLLCGVGYLHSLGYNRIIGRISGGFQYLWFALMTVWWIGTIGYLKFIVPFILGPEMNWYWHHHRWY